MLNKNEIIQGKQKSNNKKMRVEYVMIVGCKGFSSTHYLVEISKRANTRLDNLHFCREHIVHPRKQMLVTLKILREPSMFIEEDRINIIKRLVGIVVSNDNNFSKTQECSCLSADMMISNKVNAMIEASTNRWNRSDTKNKNMVTDNLRRNRDNRLSDKHAYVFKDDCNESLNEH